MDGHEKQTPDPVVLPTEIERRVRRKTDLRLCSIAGILCSLNLLDSGILSSAAVTSMRHDLGLDVGNRFSIAIFIFTLASITFQLPSTVAVRFFGPRLWFSGITVAFGLVTLCTGFVRDWRQMMALRVLLGMAMAGIYPGLTYLLSTWYTRREQQLRFAYMQSGEVLVLATGTIVNWALNRNLDGAAGLAGWQWMFVVQGSCTCGLGLATYWWMVDFPEHAHRSFKFLDRAESVVVTSRIARDRGDAVIEPYTPGRVLVHALDPKVWVFAVLFFLLNLVTTAMAYFVTIILQYGIGFDSDTAILLSAPPYYFSVLTVVLSSWLADRVGWRSPVIVFNAATLIVGFAMLGFAADPIVRYVGVFLATGAYVGNWAALSAWMTNNIPNQWGRVFAAAACSALNGAGGIAGSYVVRAVEAPRYTTATWVSIGSHVLLIALVGCLSLHFWLQNKAQRTGAKVLQQVEGFRFTY